MDGISRSCGWDKEIPHGILPMEQLVLSDKCARKNNLYQWVGLDRMCNPQRSLQSIKSRSNFILLRLVLLNYPILSTDTTPLVNLTEILELILYYA